jgi:ABC-2 type transport system permease protein
MVNNGSFLKSVFLKTLNDKRTAFLWWAGCTGLMFFWLTTMFPAMQNIGNFAQFIEVMPESYRVLVGDITGLDTLDGFLSLYLTNMSIPIIVIIYSISYGGSLLFNEEEEGTFDLLLSYPLPRWRVVLEKVAAVGVFTVALMLVSYISIRLGLVVVGESLGEVHLLAGMLNVLPMGMFFFALPLCLTALNGSRGLAGGVAGGLAAVTYLVNNLGEASNLPEWVIYLSPWYYYGGSTVLTEGINWGYFLLLTGLTAVLIALGIWGFSQRDLGT